MTRGRKVQTNCQPVPMMSGILNTRMVLRRGAGPKVEDMIARELKFTVKDLDTNELSTLIKELLNYILRT